MWEKDYDVQLITLSYIFPSVLPLLLMSPILFLILYVSISHDGRLGDVRCSKGSDNSLGLEVSILDDAILRKFNKRNAWVWDLMEG